MQMGQMYVCRPTHSWLLHYTAVRRKFHAPAFISGERTASPYEYEAGQATDPEYGERKISCHHWESNCGSSKSQVIHYTDHATPTIYKATENQSLTTRKNIHIVQYLSGTILDTNVAFDELPTLIEFSLIPLNKQIMKQTFAFTLLLLLSSLLTKDKTIQCFYQSR